MQSALRTLFTSADNQSYDIGRVVWAFGTFALIAFEGFSLFRGAVFDPQMFALSLSTLAVGHGASLKLKGDTEPEAK